ncbi:MAG: hypothetical protein Q4F23_03080 [Coriobacteriia bacterium]|nr:hypothetical protein [Coriobacteriia bacterium]
MAEDRYRYIDVDSSDDEEIIVISADTVASRDDAVRRSGDDFLSHSAFGASGSMDQGDSCPLDSGVDFAPKEDGHSEGVMADHGASTAGVPCDSSQDEPEQGNLNPEVPFLSMQRIILAALALLVVAFMVYFLAGCASSSQEESSSGRATNKTILQYDLSSDKSSTVKSRAYDVTGDGEVDTVALKPRLSSSASANVRTLSSIELVINKKTSLTISASEFSELREAESVGVKLMTLSDGKQFLFVSCDSEDGQALAGVYRLKDVKSCRAVPVITSHPCQQASWTPIRQMKDASLYAQAVENRVAVTIDFVCYATGLTEATFDFGCVGDGLEISNPEASNFGFKATNALRYDRPPVHASRSITVYQESSLSTFAFTANRGDVCNIDSLTIEGDRLAFKMTDGDKVGWFGSPDYGYQTCFDETSMTDDGSKDV